MFSSNFGFFGRASFTTCSKHRDFGKAQNYGRTFNYRPRRGTTGFSPTAGVRRHRQHVAERRQRPLPLVFVFCLRSRLQHVAERTERLLLLGSSSVAEATFTTPLSGGNLLSTDPPLPPESPGGAGKGSALSLLALPGSLVHWRGVVNFPWEDHPQLNWVGRGNS